MILSFVRRFCRGECVVAALALLVLGVGAVETGAAEKEGRQPDSAAFNSDATRIVYVDKVTPPGGLLPTTTEIWTVFPSGEGKTRLTFGHKDRNPRFGPDGKHIIFERDGDGEIWMMNADGGEVSNVTKTPTVYERDAQFSNEGDSLFLLAPAPSPLTAAELEAEPLLALGMGTVVIQLNLKDGTRREILGEEFGVKTVFPDPDDDKVALVLCYAVDDKGKPTFFSDTTLVAVPLDGSAPRSLYSAPTGYGLEMARAGGAYWVLTSSVPGEFSSQVFLLKKPVSRADNKNDLKKLDKLTFLGDLSCDGTTVIGTAITSGIDHWGLVSYDIASGKWRTVLED